jgi:quercetin dioxygenase-like cupin family protein
MSTEQLNTSGLSRRESDDNDTTIPYRGRQLAILLTAERTNGQCSVIHSTERPGSEPPQHCHQREDEICYVLAGALTYYVGDEVHQAPPGTCVFVPRGVEHTFIVDPPEAQVLTLYTPGGFEGYLREMSALRPIGADATYEIERMITTAARYGCDITGPPPAHGGHAPATTQSVLQETLAKHPKAGPT